MEKKKGSLKSAAEGAGKAAAGFFGKAKKTIVNAVDQNDDGTLDMKDVSVVAGAVGAAAKKASNAIKESREQHQEKRLQDKREKELDQLRPIFAEDLDGAEFYMPKLIRISLMDKRHSDSEVCKGSIGHRARHEELEIVNIYLEQVDQFGLTLFPDRDAEVYYVDPVDRDHYIALDDYFAFLKVARINELQRIAQELGAKHFKVTYKEQKKTFEAKSGKAIISGPNKIGADAEHDSASKEYTSVEIAAEMTCPGHAPMEPKLHYLRKESSIQTLIAMRMSNNPMLHQKYTLQLSNSSGIRVSDAVKIDAALKSMKCSANAKVTSEAQSEAHRFFEYEIDF